MRRPRHANSAAIVRRVILDFILPTASCVSMGCLRKRRLRLTQKTRRGRNPRSPLFGTHCHKAPAYEHYLPRRILAVRLPRESYSTLWRMHRRCSQEVCAWQERDCRGLTTLSALPRARHCKHRQSPAREWSSALCDIPVPRPDHHGL